MRRVLTENQDFSFADGTNRTAVPASINIIWVTLGRLLKSWLDYDKNKASMWRGAIFMSAQALRQKYNRAFARMEKHSRLTAWSIVGLYVLQIIVSVVLGHYLLQGELTFLSGLGIAVLMLFVATRMRGTMLIDPYRVFEPNDVHAAGLVSHTMGVAP